MKTTLPRRRLIPKWRQSAATLATAEAAPSRENDVHHHEGDIAEFDAVASEWRKTRAPGLLGEVLSFSFHTNLRDKVSQVAHEAKSLGAEITAVQAHLIGDMFDDRLALDSDLPSIAVGAGAADLPFQSAVRRLRASLRAYPDDPLALLDYAQLQAAVGKLNGAERALKSAFQLAPDNRTVIRTFARFLVHAQEADAAHAMVRRHRRTPTDPWLMATEIALADVAASPSLFFSRAKQIVADENSFVPSQITELAGSVAMAELFTGNLKKARAAQRRALTAPNDNVVAQAVDLEANFGIALDVPNVIRAITSSNEAQLLRAWTSGTPVLIEQFAQAWHAEEPFSSRPVQMLTTLYAYLGDIDRATKWIGAGLLADPKDVGLLVNLAFVNAKANRVEEARLVIKRIRSLQQPGVEPFLLATEGLLAYQAKDFEGGDRQYDEASQIFESKRHPQIAAYCRLNQALSAELCEHPSLEKIVANAKAMLIAHPSYDSLMLLRVGAGMGIAEPVIKPQPMRRMSQWLFDPLNNTLTERLGLTAVGAAPLVVLDNRTGATERNLRK